MSHLKKRTRPSQSGTTERVDSPPSLPPVVGEPAALSSDPSTEANTVPDEASTEPEKKTGLWGIKKGSTVHRTALKVMAMRMTGIKDREIAEQLKITVQSVRNYVHQAIKSGLIEPDWLTAKERLEDVLLPKALQNLDYAMSDTTRHSTSGMRVADQVALEVVKGTLFKEFDKTVDISSNNAIQINVVMPPGPEQEIRDGAIRGVPAFQDGEEI